MSAPTQMTALALRSGAASSEQQWQQDVESALLANISLQAVCFSAEEVTAMQPPVGQVLAASASQQAGGRMLACNGMAKGKVKTKRARGEDGERLVKSTMWCAHVMLGYHPAPLEALSATQQLQEALVNGMAADAAANGLSRARISIYMHGRREEVGEDTLDLVMKALKRVKYAEFGLQLVSISSQMDSSHSYLGATCMFRQLGTRSSEVLPQATQIKAVAVHIFNLHQVQAAPGEDPVRLSDPHPQPAPEISASAGLQRRLVKDAMKAALLDLKAAEGGRFGLSRLEARLNACLPIICNSACSILRSAVSPHLLPFAISMLDCGSEEEVAEPGVLEGALMAACRTACLPRALPTGAASAAANGIVAEGAGQAQGDGGHDKEQQGAEQSEGGWPGANPEQSLADGGLAHGEGSLQLEPKSGSLRWLDQVPGSDHHLEGDWQDGDEEAGWAGAAMPEDEAGLQPTQQGSPLTHGLAHDLPGSCMADSFVVDSFRGDHPDTTSVQREHLEQNLQAMQANPQQSEQYRREYERQCGVPGSRNHSQQRGTGDDLGVRPWQGREAGGGLQQQPDVRAGSAREGQQHRGGHGIDAAPDDPDAAYGQEDLGKEGDDFAGFEPVGDDDGDGWLF